VQTKPPPVDKGLPCPRLNRPKSPRVPTGCPPNPAPNAILVMNEGRLVEQARRSEIRSAHEELLVRGGLYTGLYETQFRHVAYPVAES